MILIHSLKKKDEINVAEECKIFGCIPASVEWILRYTQLTEKINLVSDFTEFQKKICEKIEPYDRNFSSVVKLVSEIHNIDLSFFVLNEKFQSGSAKFERIYDLIKNQKGCVIAWASIVSKLPYLINGIDVPPEKTIEIDPALKTEELLQQIDELMKPRYKIISSTNGDNSAENEKIIIQPSIHITPVIACSQEELIVADLYDSQEKIFDRKLIEGLHDRLDIGRDILWINTKK